MKPRKFEHSSPNYKLQSHQSNNDNVLSDGDGKHRCALLRKQQDRNTPSNERARRSSLRAWG